MAKSKALVPTHNTLAKAFSIVPYLTREEIKRMIAAISGRHKARDELLILLLYQTGLRISEALSLTPRMIGLQDGKAALFIIGKGKKARMVACPSSLAHRLKSYAYDRRIAVDEKLFEINRKRAWQIVTQIAKGAGIHKRVYPHLLRHSDAIERLRQTGNPKALQLHLGHSSPAMTLRYLSTLTAEDALRIQQDVDFDS
ncbi:MAG: tyrosine-type recombinase/integrase [Syntrophorhabdales bacterium]|jgi:integrase